MANEAAGGDLEQALREREQRVAALEADVTRLKEELEQLRAARIEGEAARAKEVRCPKCRFLMDEVVEHGIVLDMCRGCRGIYFDDGEVDQLIRTIEQDKPPASFFQRLFRRGA